MKKRAFSLIEVLLVMSIIAVVTAMGFSISRRGVENAYNLYWYTGYSALYDGTRDAFKKGILSTDNTNPSLDSYARHICNLVYGDNCSSSPTNFTAPNGISFLMEAKTNYFKITMTIPSPKTMRNFPNKTIFVYNYNLSGITGGYVYPAVTPAADTSMLNLQNRADLLPFYVKTNQSTVISNFYGFRAAYCRTNGNITVSGTDIGINCNGLSGTDEGVIFPISPKKAF